MWWFVLACATRVTPVPAAEGRDADGLPAGTTAVIRSSGPTNPVVMALGTLEEPCVEALAGELDVIDQIQRDPRSEMIFVGHGAVSREAFEACAEQVGERVDPAAAQLGLRVERDEALTVFRTPGGTEYVASFDPGRVVFARTRAQVEAVTLGPPLELDAPLRKLLPRLEGEGHRTITSVDIAGPLTGVASIGAVITMGPDPATTSEARLVFATPEAATRFVDVVHRLAEGTDANPIARELAAAAAPVAEGPEVVLDLVALMDVLSRPERAGWLQQAVLASGSSTVDTSGGVRLVYRDPGDPAAVELLRQRAIRLVGADNAVVTSGEGVIVVELREALPGIGAELVRPGSLTLCPNVVGVAEGDPMEPCPPTLGLRDAARRPDGRGGDLLWFALDDAGAVRLSEVSTTALAAGERMLVVLDGVVVAAPRLWGAITGGQVMMQPGPWAGDLDVFAAAVGAGVLDVPLELLEEEPL